jgi:hypothetical protein
MRMRRPETAGAVWAFPKTGTVTMGEIGTEQPAIPLSDRKPIEAPVFYVDGVNASLPGNDATIVFMRGRPALANHPPNQIGVVREPAVVLQMSVRTLKDLHLVLSLIVDGYEKEYGNIETPYTRQNEKIIRQ